MNCKVCGCVSKTFTCESHGCFIGMSVKFDLQFWDDQGVGDMMAYNAGTVGV